MQTFRKTPQQDSNGLIIHVSSFNDRSTEVVTHDRIRVGTTDDCEVKVRLSKEPATPTNDPVIELVRLNGIYRIESFNPALDVKLNGRLIKANKGIYDGDEIWIGPSGPSIHFFPIATTTAMVPGRRGSTHVAPFIEQAAMEASATARRDDAKIFFPYCNPWEVTSFETVCYEKAEFSIHRSDETDIFCFVNKTATTNPRP